MNTLIIGANRGIGLALVQNLVKNGHTVYATTRKESAELATLTDHVFTGVDVSDDNCFEELVAKIPDHSLDVIISNAGIWTSETIDDFDTQTMLHAVNVNAISAMRVAKHLRSKLKNPGKLVLMTSRMGSIEDNGSGGRYSYRLSKTALNAVGKSLSIDLKPEGVAIGIIHPGSVQTDMGSAKSLLTAAESAEGILERTTELNLENTGTFWHVHGDVLPW